MHSIDLKNIKIRSDLIIESLNNINESYSENDIVVDYIHLNKDNKLKKNPGDYITISFIDITDNNNYNNVLKVLDKELNRILKLSNIKKKSKGLIIGLGNKKSTPDSLGYEVLKHINVTRYLDELEVLDNNYRSIAILEPNVIGNTGIDSYEIILGVVKNIKPDFIIAIDSLASNSTKRIEKTIQITNSGIEPGSGIGNNRKELTLKTLKIPVIAIGVPTVVSSAIIVQDTIEFLMKKISYHKNNYNKDKLIPKYNIKYEKTENNLSKFEREKLLGLIGTLSDKERMELILEVLNPIGYNFIVSTKEIDFMIEKLGELIGTSLNHVLHK